MGCCSGRRRLQTCQEWTQRPALKSGSEESPGVRNYSEDPDTEALPMRGKPQQQKAKLTRPQASAFSQIFPGRSLRLLSAPSRSQVQKRRRKRPEHRAQSHGVPVRRRSEPQLRQSTPESFLPPVPSSFTRHPSPKSLI